ncbi:photosynthetic reaction center subunit H, partial [Thioalkalicoccus limnaeus]
MFWVFFGSLVFYLRREDKREGYPLEHSGGRIIRGFPPMPKPKTYLLPHGLGTVTTPRVRAEPETINATPVGSFYGAPQDPIGDPMLAGVGPGAAAGRMDVPDMTIDGEPKIVPMRVATEFSIHPKDPDPRGLAVVGADGEVGGTVTDVWVDRSEPQTRYLEVSVAGTGRNVLLPTPMLRIKGKGAQRKVIVSSILGSQFANVPGLANPDQVTLLEEDRICAYYACGQLFARPSRR